MPCYFSPQIHVSECNVIIGMHHLKMNMVEEWLHLDVFRETRGMHLHHQFNDLVVSPIR